MERILSLTWAFLFITQLHAQNVGIGITNPTRARLEVSGAMGSTNAIFGSDATGISLQRNYPAIGFNQYNDGTSKYLGNGFAANQWLHTGTGWLAIDMFPNGTANTAPVAVSRALTLTPEGHIGLAGASPNGYLQFPNNLNNRKIVLYESANNNHQFYGFGIESGTLRYTVDNPGAAHKFYAAGSTNSSNFLMSIGGDKRVLIGQQDQGFKLGINAYNPIYTIEMVQAGNKGLGFINPLNGYHYWEMKSEIYGTGSDCLILYYDGGTSPKGWFRPTDGGYTSVSDFRLKKDIKAMESILPGLMQLRPSRYHFKVDSQQHECIGLIAQDVRKLFPELVDIKKTDDNPEIPDLHGINYSGLSVIAIKAIQEQQQQIESLKNEITQLKKMQTELLQRLKANGKGLPD